MNANLVTPKAPDQTRQKLLEAAFAEIYRNGFQAASLANILDAANLTKGALYHHFPDKKALGLAVVAEMIQPRLHELMLAPLATTHAPLATLRAQLSAKLAEEDPQVLMLGCPLNNLIQEMSPVDETFRLCLNGLFQTWVTTLATALERGQTSGEVSQELNAQETAFFLVSALEGCIGMSKNTQSLTAFRGCLRQLLRYLDTLSA
jgi:AcrR family transcriptional regulator